jgi:amino-acid N-acetyltransferase
MIHHAKLSDVPTIKKLIDSHAQHGKMLYRPLADLYTNVREFLVAERDGVVIGCAALRIFTGTLGEIRSIAVADSVQGQGVGRDLVQALIKEAAELGLEQVFALTYVGPFFEKLGFRKVADKAEFPQKVWSDCINCPKFPDCDEEALILEIKSAD